MIAPTAAPATLVVDIGNARMKWARLEGTALVDRGHALHAGPGAGTGGGEQGERSEAALAAFTAALPPRVGRVLVANVAGAGLAARLAERVAERCGARIELAATAHEALGVRCGYRDPARLGVDRWLAVIAAHTRVRRAATATVPPACVINAGTAMTFDAVDGGGQHLGGLILAGPRIAAAALQRHTERIGATATPADAAPRGLDLLGRSTDEAVGRGALLGPAAAFDRAVTVVERALGQRPRVFLAGGDGALLAEWLETEVELRADLVLEGLALLAAGDAGRTRGAS